MSNNLKNKILLSDNEKCELFKEDHITLDDVKKPILEINEEHHKYTFKFKDYTMLVDFEPRNYRTMNITITKPTPENIPENIYLWNWDYAGNVGMVI